MAGSEIIKSITERDHRIIVKVDMDALIESQPDHRVTEKHYVLTCPACSEEKARKGESHYSKKKLYITKDKKVGYCQRCHCVYIRYFEADVDNIILLGGIPRFDTYQTTFDSLATIPSIFNGGMDYFKNAKPLSPELVEFLRGRRSYSVIKNLDLLNFRCYNNEEILIPFHFMDDDIYYQINYVHPKALKYFNPPIKRKPIYVLRPGYSTLVLCEGIYDAIAVLELYPNTTAVALLGCDVTDYHIWMIRRLCPAQILIYMDETKLSMAIYYELMRSPLGSYCKMFVVESDGTDPEEQLIRISKQNGQDKGR